MTDRPVPPPDPFSPGDDGAIAVHSMYLALRRAGAGMVEAVMLVAAQSAMVFAVQQAQQQKPPEG